MDFHLLLSWGSRMFIKLAFQQIVENSSKRDTATEQQIEDAIDLGESMRLSQGDSQDQWAERKPSILAFCDNCEHRWVVGFQPMNPERLAKALDRAGFCSKCLEGERVRFFGLDVLEKFAKSDYADLSKELVFRSCRTPKMRVSSNTRVSVNIDRFEECPTATAESAFFNKRFWDDLKALQRMALKVDSIKYACSLQPPTSPHKCSDHLFYSHQ